MNDVELDARIRDLLQAVHAEAPAPPPFPSVVLHAEGREDSGTPSDYVVVRSPHERRHRRTRAVLAAAAAVAVAVAVVVVWTRGTEDSAPPAGPAPIVTGESVDVVHEVWQYTQSADLTCPNGEISAGDFATSTFETWTDLSGTRIRQDIVYPDGSTRSVLQVDATSRPSPAPLLAGEPRGQIVGCRGVMNFVTEPATTAPEDLTTPVGPASDGALEGLGSQASHAVSPQFDSLGRPAELWVVGGGGSIESVGPIRQNMSYYLDPDTGLLIERSFTEYVGAYGSFTQRFTRMSREQVSVDASTFEPSASDQASTIATTAPGSAFQEEGTCARGGSASVCLIRRDGAVLVKGAGLAPDSTVELALRLGGTRTTQTVTTGSTGTIDTQPVVDPIEPASAVIIAGITGQAADGYPLNSSITLRP